MILKTWSILEFADDKKSVFFLQTYIGTLEVIIEFKLRRAERDNWPEGFTDTVTNFLKKLAEIETFAFERCGKNYSRVRNGLLEKDNFKADFCSGIIATKTPSAPFLKNILLFESLVKAQLILFVPPVNSGNFTQDSKILLAISEFSLSLL